MNNFFNRNPKVKLSAPWYILLSKLQATIGADKSLIIFLVEDNSNIKTIKVISKELWKAEALSLLLIPKYEFDNIIVNICVYYNENPNPIIPPSLPSELPTNIASLLVVNRALQNNPFFYLAFPPCILNSNESLENISTENLQEIPAGEANIVVAFKRIVVQYYTDNLADFFLNVNQVPSVAFGSVFVDVLFDESVLTFTETPDVGKDF